MIGKGRNRRIWPFIVPPPKSPLILDNVGLTISLEMLDGWPDYKKAYNSLFGVNWLSKLWMGWIYSIIRPKRYVELKQVFESQRCKMQQSYLNAVLEAAEEAI